MELPDNQRDSCENENLQFVLFARLLLFAAHLNHRNFLLIALTLNGEA